MARLTLPSLMVVAEWDAAPGPELAEPMRAPGGWLVGAKGKNTLICPTSLPTARRNITA